MRSLSEGEGPTTSIMLEKIIIPEIQKLLQEKNYSALKELIPPLAEDIAYIISEIENPSYQLLLFRMIPSDTASEVFASLNPEEQENIIKSLTGEEIKDIVNNMSTDDRTALFEEMPAELVKKLISLLSWEDRRIAVEILNYPENSVGRLLTPDFVEVYEESTVQEALANIIKVGLEKETVYYSYVVDNLHKLKGIVSLKTLVLSQRHKKLQEIMFDDVIKVNPTTDKEQAAALIKKYSFMALPVVDNCERIIGIVTFDDLVEVIEEAATEDFEKMAGVIPVDKPYFEAKFLDVAGKRIFWLIVLVFAESLSSNVLQHYSDVIQKVVSLTFFIPLLIGTAGNAGTQSSAMIIRGLATGDVTTQDFWKVIFRESLMGVAMGAALSVFGFIRALMQQHDWQISVAVGIAMAGTIVLATISASALPLFFKRIRLDPALMSSPLITTVVDVIGIYIYFEIAQFILGI